MKRVGRTVSGAHPGCGYPPTNPFQAGNFGGRGRVRMLLAMMLSSSLLSSTYLPAGDATLRRSDQRRRYSSAASPSSPERRWAEPRRAYTRAFFSETRASAETADPSSPKFAERRGMRIVENMVAAFLIAVQMAVPLCPAEAVLYSPDTKVPKTGELALRRAIPANSNMKAIQESLEEISYLLRIPQRKPYGTMEGNVKKSLKIATEQKDSILGGVPSDLQDSGSLLYAALLDGKGGLKDLLQYVKEKDPDRVSVSLASSLDTLAELELLQAPGLSFLLPQQYAGYPRLTGRGVVELTVEKTDGSTFFPSGGGDPKSTATIQVVLDGYSAPLTAGNFAKQVEDGAYDGVQLKCVNLAILSDNEAAATGFPVPLEVMPAGEFEPLYKTKLSIQDGELPVLPLSVYGAVAMAHNTDSEEYSSPSQFFFYLYDKRNSGLGGLSFDEGQFSVFGYTTAAGRRVLAEIKTGDVIRSAKLVQGRERLLLPLSSS